MVIGTATVFLILSLSLLINEQEMEVECNHVGTEA